MKKLLLILLVPPSRWLAVALCVGGSLLAFSQSKWSPRASLPDSDRGYGIGFSIGNYGYVGLGASFIGSHDYYFHDFWRFNPSTDSWTRMSDFPGLARIWPETFVIGNYAYVVTGQDTAINYVTECWRYDATNNTWTQKANFPGASRAYGVGFAIGHKGYVGTGSKYLVDYRKDFWSYDTITDSWTQIADLPSTARFGANGFAVNGNGYICLGADSLYTYYNEIWEYDTSNNTWTQKSNCPDSLYTASGFVIGNNIYVGTGANSTMYFKKFWEYNTTADFWTQETDFPGPSRSICSAFSVGDTGYLGFGEDTASLYFNSMYRFYPDSIFTNVSNLTSINNDVLIYPNPFNEICLVSILANSNNSNVIFNLFDIQGKEVNVNIKESSNNYIISRGGLQTGVYILSIGFNNQIIPKKLIITN